MIRSDKEFAPEQSNKNDAEVPTTPFKEKYVVNTEARGWPSKKSISLEEDKEFLRIIRKSDYKIIN